MHPRQQPGSSCILVITIHKILPCLVVQRAFWKGHNHQTSNDREDMTQGSCGRPVLLQSIDADGTGGRVDIGMVYFGTEVSAWGRGREIGGEDKFELEVARVVWCLLGSLDFSLCALGGQETVSDKSKIGLEPRQGRTPLPAAVTLGLRRHVAVRVPRFQRLLPRLLWRRQPRAPSPAAVPLRSPAADRVRGFR